MYKEQMRKMLFFFPLLLFRIYILQRCGPTDLQTRRSHGHDPFSRVLFFCLSFSATTASKEGIEMAPPSDDRETKDVFTTSFLRRAS